MAFCPLLAAVVGDPAAPYFSAEWAADLGEAACSLCLNNAWLGRECRGSSRGSGWQRAASWPLHGMQNRPVTRHSVWGDATVGLAELVNAAGTPRG